MIKKIMGILLLLLIVQCNIFDWGEEDPFYEGLKLFNEKKFSAAKEKFAAAMEQDPYRSDYRYYHAKAVIFESGLNFFTIARQIIKIDTTMVTDWKLPLYTREADMSLEEEAAYKNSIYQVAAISHDDISPIFHNQTHGDIQPGDTYFEFAILSLARAILQLRDTNNDAVIDLDDLYFKIIKVYNPYTGNYLYLPNLMEIVDYLNSSADNVNGFNMMLTNSATYAVEGIEAITNIFSDTVFFNNDDLKNIIENINEMSGLYQVADGIDNDGDGEDNDNNPATPAIKDGIDNDNDGLVDEGIDEEIINGMDDDNDGIIDEDTHLNNGRLAAIP